MTTDERIDALVRQNDAMAVEIIEVRAELREILLAVGAGRRPLTKKLIAADQSVSYSRLYNEPWRFPPEPDVGQRYSREVYEAWKVKPEEERKAAWINATAKQKRAWRGIKEAAA